MRIHRNPPTCSRCGALRVGAAAVCPRCGVVTHGLRARVAAALFGRRLSFTQLLVVLNSAVFAVLVVLSVPSLDSPLDLLTEIFIALPSADVSYGFGSLTYAPVVEQHQWWRLITWFFMHQGVIHLLLNMMVLRLLGPAAENLLGRPKYILLFLGSGLGSSLASLYGNAAGTASVGASGALMGLVSGLLVYGLRRGGSMGRMLVRQMLIYTGLVFGLGWIVPVFRIDHFAHGGGYIAGALLTLFLARGAAFDGQESRWHRRVALLGMLAVLVCLGFGSVQLSRQLATGGGAFEASAKEQWSRYRNNLEYLVQGLPEMDEQERARVEREYFRPFTAAFEEAVHRQGEELEWLPALITAQQNLHQLLQKADIPAPVIQAKAILLGRQMDESPWKPEPLLPDE